MVLCLTTCAHTPINFVHCAPVPTPLFCRSASSGRQSPPKRKTTSILRGPTACISSTRGSSLRLRQGGWEHQEAWLGRNPCGLAGIRVTAGSCLPVPLPPLLQVPFQLHLVQEPPFPDKGSTGTALCRMAEELEAAAVVGNCLKRDARE